MHEKSKSYRTYLGTLKASEGYKSMEWFERLNSAMQYIEENIDQEIDFEEIAKIACCSVYHFQRMFSFITDVPLSEYIRRRRLTLAAFELQNSDIRIIDLALKYGYETHESFSRAFQKLHGTTPRPRLEPWELSLKPIHAYPFRFQLKGMWR